MVKDRFGVELNYKRAWCAKQQALLSIYRTWEGSYSPLPRFLEALQHFNPGIVLESGFLRKTMTRIYMCDLILGPSNVSFGPLNLALKASIIVNLLSPLTAHTCAVSIVIPY